MERLLIDLEWSEWTWNDHGYWYCSRLELSGEYEYDYKYTSEEEYAAEEDSSMQRVLEYSSSPPTTQWFGQAQHPQKARILHRTA